MILEKNEDLCNCNQKLKKTYSDSDFERFFIRYKEEVVPAGKSLQNFCFRNRQPYNLFEKWYNDTRHKVVPVQV